MTKSTLVTHVVSFRYQWCCQTLWMSSHGYRRAGIPLRPSLLPPHFVQPQAPWEPPQDDTATVNEGEVFARDEPMDDVRDQDLAGLCTVADTEGRVDGSAEQSTFCDDRLTSVEANTDMHRMGGMLLVMPGECLLNGHGACNGTGGRGEGGLDAVAGMRDFVAMVHAQTIADDGVVAAHELMRLLIAPPLDKASGALHVGHEDDAQRLRSFFANNVSECKWCLKTLWRLGLRHESLFYSIGNGCCTISDTDLGEEVVHMIGNGFGTQDQVVSDFLVGATLGDMPQNFDLPRAEIVWIRGTLLRYQRYVGLECLGKLHCLLGKGLHAKFEQERACLLHQLNCLAAVARRATGYQQTSVVQVSTS